MTDEIPLHNANPEDASGVGQAEPEYFNLYQKREKIYTRAVEGFFQKLRLFTGWPLLIGFFAIPWINWDGRQSVFFDLPSRQFFIFELTFWPQDFAMLAWLLIIAAFSLFFVTSWLGRVWCGYTCPQTVWTSIFMWVEQLAEGDRNARIKLDKAPNSTNKIVRKSLKHGMWLGVSVLTAIGFVGYFTPVRDLVINLVTFNLSTTETFWIGLFTLGTYGNAGWLREQVCMYMCPYARFQAVMFDQDTLIVSYDPKRGDPRGSRKKTIDHKEQGMGDCIDCQMCVQVCPTGIDIRDGLQYECINCALCIDACDEIMDRMQYPRKLISYTTEKELAGGKSVGILRPRLMGYAAALTIMTILFGYKMVGRTPLELDIIRGRGELFTETRDGKIENSYTLKILNKGQSSARYQIRVEGVEKAQFIGSNTAEAGPGELLELPVRVQISPKQLTLTNTDINFVVTILDKDIEVSEESRFLGPRPF